MGNNTLGYIFLVPNTNQFTRVEKKKKKIKHESLLVTGECLLNRLDALVVFEKEI